MDWAPKRDLMESLTNDEHSGLLQWIWFEFNSINHLFTLSIKYDKVIMEMVSLWASDHTFAIMKSYQTNAHIYRAFHSISLTSSLNDWVELNEIPNRIKCISVEKMIKNWCSWEVGEMLKLDDFSVQYLKENL